MDNEWFRTSRSGLRKQAKERGAPHVFLEVAASNPLDEREAGMTSVAIEVEPVKDRPLARVTVEDDSPVGFRGRAREANRRRQAGNSGTRERHDPAVR